MTTGLDEHEDTHEKQLSRFPVVRVVKQVLLVLAILAGAGTWFYQQATTPLWTLVPETKVTRLISSPDGGVVALLHEDNQLSLLNPLDGTIITWLSRPAIKPDLMAFSQNGRWFAAAASSGREVSLWETTNGNLQAVIEAGSAGKKGKYVTHDAIQWRDLNTGKTYSSRAYIGGKSGTNVRGLSVLDDGSVITVDSAGQVTQWSSSGYKLNSTATVKHVSKSFFSPDANRLAVSGSNRLVVVSVPDGNHITTLSDSGPFEEVSFSGDGKYLAASVFGKRKVFELVSGKISGQYDGYAKVVKFSGDACHLLFATKDEIEIRNVCTGDIAGRIDKKAVTSATFYEKPGYEDAIQVITHRPKAFSIWDVSSPETPDWQLERDSESWAFAPGIPVAILLVKDGSLEAWKLP